LGNDVFLHGDPTEESMMEWLATVLGVIFIVLLVGTAFSASGVRGPWPNLFWFFMLLFLGTLALGVWADPIGPRVAGVPWLGFLVTAILIGLLIAAATPDHRHGRRRPGRSPDRSKGEPDVPFEHSTQPAPLNPRETTRDESGTIAALSIFFWIFAILAIAVVAVRFFTVAVPG